MAVLVNRAKMSTSTTGTGTITLGSAEDGYQTFADAGVANSDVVRYVIEDGSNFEIGTGTYTSSGTTLSRTVSESSNSDAAINLSGSATVFIGATAEDIPALYADNPSSATTPVASGANAVAIAFNARASASDAVAIGENAYAQGAESFSIGTQTDAIGTRAGAFGYNALAQGNYSMAFGNAGAFSTESFAAAIANNTNTYGASGANSIALGDRSKASGSRGIAISGYGALASGASSLALGYQATANQSYASGFGYASKAYGAYSFAGTESHASGSKSVALGLGDTSTSYGALHDNGVALGYQATTSAAKQIALGSSTAQVKISGAYTLPTADGSANEVLQTNGSGQLSFAAAGGGPDLFAENWNGTTTQPSATGVNAVAIGTSSNSTGTGALSAPHSNAGGNYSFAAAIGNSTSSYGSQGNNSVAFGQNSLSYGLNSAALGANAQALGTGSSAVGQSYSSGSYAFAAAINNNTSSYGATGANSIAGGYLNKASSSDSLCWGGDTNICHNSQSAIVGGQLNDCSGGYSFITGGYNNNILGTYSRAGGKDADTGDNLGKDAYASGKFSSRGDCQTAKRILMRSTTDATATVLTAQGNAPNTFNQVILPNNSAYAFHGTIVAREKASEGTECAAWKVEGLIRREANAGTTVLVNSATTVLDNTPNWGMALSADTTNGALAITCTGAASTNIRWVATVHTSEVTYA